MDIEEFEDLLDRLGEDLTRWPVEKRRSASTLLAESAEARELLQESVSLRNLLSRGRIAAPSGLVDQIIVGSAQHSGDAGKRATSWFPKRLAEPRTLFLSLCFVGGILAGVLSSKPVYDPPEANVHDYVAYILNFIYPVD